MARLQRQLLQNDGAAPVGQSKRKLDKLDARVAKQLILFQPTPSVVKDLMAKARLSIPGLADTSDVLRVLHHNPECLVAVARRSKFNPAAPSGEGFIAVLPLNRLGLEQLALDSLNAVKPDVRLLATQKERPVAIYMWCVFIPGPLAGAMALFMERMKSEQYAGVDILARPVTEDGLRFSQILGLTPGIKVGEIEAPGIWVFPRKRPAPLYDSYVPGAAKNEIGVTVARSFDDLMRVVAIRNAVYIGEQECPYNEEYDGNDLSATHLLAYIGDEPVGCLRLRFFADFAKFERMAIRKEFRKSRAAIQLARAGFQLCGKKGYQRVYGHVQERLVTFWSRFGFRLMEGGKKFMFSDFEYVEIVADIERDPEAVTIGVDPYVIIRPEGRWHVPGVLEESAARDVTRPSVGKGH